jgi:hypothetical protein
MAKRRWFRNCLSYHVVSCHTSVMRSSPVSDTLHSSADTTVTDVLQGHASVMRSSPVSDTLHSCKRNISTGPGHKRRCLLFHSLVHASLLLGSGNGLDDVGKLGLERGAADKEAIDVGAGRQGRGVGSVGRATVLREGKGGLGFRV